MGHSTEAWRDGPTLSSGAMVRRSIAVGLVVGLIPVVFFSATILPVVNRHTWGAIERLLTHPDSDVRLAALEQMPPFFNQPQDRRQSDIVSRLERDDSDPRIRALATQRLGREGNRPLTH